MNDVRNFRITCIDCHGAFEFRIDVGLIFVPTDSPAVAAKIAEVLQEQGWRLLNSFSSTTCGEAALGRCPVCRVNTVLVFGDEETATRNTCGF